MYTNRTECTEVRSEMENYCGLELRGLHKVFMNEVTQCFQAAASSSSSSSSLSSLIYVMRQTKCAVEKVATASRVVKRGRDPLQYIT